MSKKYLTNEKTPITESRNFEMIMSNYFRTNNNSLNILMPFYNPLQYSLKIYTTYSDDPALKTYEDFMNSFSKTFELMAPQLNINSIPIEAISGNTLKELGITATSKGNFQYINTGIDKINAIRFGVNINSILLRDWVYQLLQKPYLKDAYTLELSKAIMIAENFVVGKINIEGEEKSIDDWIKSESETLYNIDNIKSFENELTKAENLLTKLQEIERVAIENKSNVISLVEAQPYAKNADGSPDFLFQNYSKVTSSYFEITVEPLFEQKKDKIIQFQTFLQKLRSDYNETYKTTKQSFNPLELANVGDFSMQDDKDLTISIGLRKLEQNGNKTADTLGISFTVVHQNKLNVVPSFSAGFVFFNNSLDYMSYSLENKIITENINSKSFQPVVFLNFYSHLTGKLYAILPQIGVTNATDVPGLLFGAGLSVLNRFSFTAGIPISFSQQLKGGKNPGDSLEESESLGDYTTYKWNRSFPAYFSVSYRLGKK